MPDAARRSTESLVTDLLDAADRYDPEAPEWLHSGYINSSTAEWAHDDRSEPVALRETLEPSIVLLELQRPISRAAYAVATRVTTSGR
jgi:hypothetical protein